MSKGFVDHRLSGDMVTSIQLAMSFYKLMMHLMKLDAERGKWAN